MEIGWLFSWILLQRSKSQLKTLISFSRTEHKANLWNQQPGEGQEKVLPNMNWSCSKPIFWAPWAHEKGSYGRHFLCIWIIRTHRNHPGYPLGTTHQTHGLLENPPFIYLVGGIPTPSQLGWLFHILWENKKCSKPATRDCWFSHWSLHLVRGFSVVMSDLPDTHGLRTDPSIHHWIAMALIWRP